jgi:hypothetical protein
MPTKLIVNCETGEQTEVELTAEEIAELEAAAAQRLIDAAGDLIYGTGSDAATRLAIGTASQVLTVNGGATAPEWVTASAGGMTLITSGNFPTDATSLSITSIPTVYKNLVLVCRGVSFTGADRIVRMRVNNDSSGIYSQTTTEVTGNAANSTSSQPSPLIYRSSTTTSLIITFYDYANTSTYKTMESIFSFRDNATPTFAFGSRIITARTVTAITEINLGNLAGDVENFDGGSYLLYGVN